MSDETPTTPNDSAGTRPPGGAGTTEPDAPTTPGRAGKSPRRNRADDPLRGSRTSGIWAAVVALGVVLVLLIIFIAQNTSDVEVAFLGWNGRAPLSVTLLIAAVAGLFLATFAGMLRIFQLRRRVRRDERA